MTKKLKNDEANDLIDNAVWDADRWLPDDEEYIEEFQSSNLKYKESIVGEEIENFYEYFFSGLDEEQEEAYSIAIERHGRRIIKEVARRL